MKHILWQIQLTNCFNNQSPTSMFITNSDFLFDQIAKKNVINCSTFYFFFIFSSTLLGQPIRGHIVVSYRGGAAGGSRCQTPAKEAAASSALSSAYTFLLPSIIPPSLALLTCSLLPPPANVPSLRFLLSLLILSSDHLIPAHWWNFIFPLNHLNNYLHSFPLCPPILPQLLSNSCPHPLSILSSSILLRHLSSTCLLHFVHLSTLLLSSGPSSSHSPLFPYLLLFVPLLHFLLVSPLPSFTPSFLPSPLLQFFLAVEQMSFY